MYINCKSGDNIPNIEVSKENQLVAYNASNHYYHRINNILYGHDFHQFIPKMIGTSASGLAKG